MRQLDFTAQEKIKEIFESKGFSVNLFYPENNDGFKRMKMYGEFQLDYISNYDSIGMSVKKGMFITQRDLYSFSGKYYILIPEGDLSHDNLLKARVIRNTTVRNYYEKVSSERKKQSTKYSDNILGYRFTKLLNYMTLKDFFIFLTKCFLGSSSIDEQIKLFNNETLHAIPKSLHEKIKKLPDSLKREHLERIVTDPGKLMVELENLK